MSFGNILKLGLGLYGAKQQYDAGKDAEKNADRNAELIERETAENTRRMKASQGRAQSTLRARMAASGIKSSGGSSKTFLDEYVKEDENQLEWLQESGASQASITRRAGKDQKSAYKSSALGSFFSTTEEFGSKQGWWS
jgi:hypothetical protein